MGDRGTGKSTTIRALAELLPAITVVQGDPYNSSPNDPDLQSSIDVKYLKKMLEYVKNHKKKEFDNTKSKLVKSQIKKIMSKIMEIEFKNK